MIIVTCLLLLSLCSTPDALVVTSNAFHQCRNKIGHQKLHHHNVRHPPSLKASELDFEGATKSSRTDDAEELSETIDQKSIIQFPAIDPVIVSILAVYFVQGALGLARLAVTFYLKDDLHLSPADAGVITGFTTLPWVIKPLYGFLSDGFPIFGYKRRSYLILAGVLGCASWIALGTIVSDTTGAVVSIIAGSTGVAISDVVADSIVVEKSRTLSNQTTNEGNDDTSLTANAGDLQSLCWGSAACGGILSAYFSGSLLQAVTPKIVFLITSLFPLLTAGASLLIDEKRLPEEDNVSWKDFSSSVQSQLQDLWTTLRNPKIYLPVLFVFLWQATPTPDTAMFYFSTNELHFQPEFLGRVRLASSVAALVGVLLYRTWFKDVSVRNLIFWTTIVSVPLSLTQVMLTTHYNRVLGIPDELFSLTDSVVLTVLGQVAFMPVLALAASLCPPGVEGTLFASLMSIYNAAGALGSELGAGLTSLLKVTDTNFDSLTTLVTICSVSSLLPIPLLDVLMDTSRDNASSAVSENDGKSPDDFA